MKQCICLNGGFETFSYMHHFELQTHLGYHVFVGGRQIDTVIQYHVTIHINIHIVHNMFKY